MAVRQEGTPCWADAMFSDPQGASFSVIDLTTTEGEMPKTSDVP